MIFEETVETHYSSVRAALTDVVSFSDAFDIQDPGASGGHFCSIKLMGYILTDSNPYEWKSKTYTGPEVCRSPKEGDRVIVVPVISIDWHALHQSIGLLLSIEAHYSNQQLSTVLVLAFRVAPSPTCLNVLKHLSINAYTCLM